MSLRTRLGVDIDADTRGIDSGARRAGNSLRTMGRIGRSVAVGLAGALTAAAAAGGFLAKSAAEDELAAKRLEFQVQRVTDATDREVRGLERWISMQGKRLGVVDDELRPSLSKLVAATKDVDKAQRLSALAMDVSAASGKSLDTVTMSLVRAQNGSISGLSRLGVQTKNAAGDTLTLNQVTKQLAETYGGSAAAAADTAAGRYGRLRVQLGEIGEELGSKLLPYGVRLGEWALGMLPKVERFAGALGERLGPALAKVGGFIRDEVVPRARAFYEWFVEKIAPGLKRTVNPILEGVRDFLGEVGGALSDNKDEFKDLAEFVANDVLPVLGKLARDVLPVLGKGIGKVIDSLAWLIDKFITAKEWCDKLIAGIKGIDWGKIRGGVVEGIVPDIDLPGLPGFGRSVMPLPSLSPDVVGTGGGTTYVDRRDFSVNVRVDGSGVVDENAIARQLVPILERHQLRIGRPFPTGGAA